MSDLHPDHVTPVLALEDPDACSPLVLRSAGYQAAKIIRKLTNDLGYAEQAKTALAAEITRLRADLAAVERERDALIKALERLASPETFYAGGRVAPETFARMTYAKHILAGEDASDAKSFAIAAGFERAVNGAVDARAALEKPHG